MPSKYPTTIRSKSQVSAVLRSVSIKIYSGIESLQFKVSLSLWGRYKATLFQLESKRSSLLNALPKFWRSYQGRIFDTFWTLYTSSRSNLTSQDVPFCQNFPEISFVNVNVYSSTCIYCTCIYLISSTSPCFHSCPSLLNLPSGTGTGARLQRDIKAAHTVS